jgi:hypothetical protein
MLCAVSVLNVLAWTLAVMHARRHQTLHEPGTWRSMRLQMLLSAGYVAGCAYRSVFPVYDVQRLTLVDGWWSSVLVGRSVATLAELCFVMQWALLLRAVASDTGNRFGTLVSRRLVPMIVVAELCSWYAVLTTSNIGHVIEESLWGLGAALLVASLALSWPRSRPELRPMLAAVCVIGAGYVVYMFHIDVPMYWARWVHDLQQGRQFFSVAEGLADTAGRWVVSHRWDDWHTEIVWMSLYFSVAVWLSISLIHAAGRVALRPRLQLMDPDDRHAPHRPARQPYGPPRRVKEKSR